jgi:hypothetical protein
VGVVDPDVDVWTVPAAAPRAEGDEAARRLAQVEEMVARTHERAAEFYETWLDRQVRGDVAEFARRARRHRESASSARSVERAVNRVLRMFEVRVEASAGGAGRPLVLLAGLSRLRVLVDRRIEEAVAACRRDGATWAQIASALGITRQTAHERYRHLSG